MGDFLAGLAFRDRTAEFKSRWTVAESLHRLKQQISATSTSDGDHVEASLSPGGVIIQCKHTDPSTPVSPTFTGRFETRTGGQVWLVGEFTLPASEKSVSSNMLSLLAIGLFTCIFLAALVDLRWISAVFLLLVAAGAQILGLELRRQSNEYDATWITELFERTLG